MRKTYKNPSVQSVSSDWDIEDSRPRPAAKPLRHFFQYATLARALDSAVARRDSWLLPQQMRSAIKSVSGTAIAENHYSIDIAIAFRDTSRRTSQLRLVVARNEEEFAKMLKAEARNLAALAPRLDKLIFPPLTRGTLFLPDRHQGAAKMRRIAAYTTRPLPESYLCGISRTGQLVAYAASPRLLSMQSTDAVRGTIIEICLRSYDSVSRTAMPPPDLERGDMRLALRGKNPTPVVAGCPFLWDHLDPVALLHRLTGFDWKEADRVLPLLPPDHSILRDAMVAALGKSDARAWAKDYAAALAKGRYKPHHRFSMDDLADLRESLGH
jgi:hypothetical protein